MMRLLAARRCASVAFSRNGKSIRGVLRTTIRAIEPTWRASTSEPSMVNELTTVGRSPARSTVTSRNVWAAGTSLARKLASNVDVSTSARSPDSSRLAF